MVRLILCTLLLVVPALGCTHCHCQDPETIINVTIPHWTITYAPGSEKMNCAGAIPGGGLNYFYLGGLVNCNTLAYCSSTPVTVPNYPTLTYVANGINPPPPERAHVGNATIHLVKITHMYPKFLWVFSPFSYTKYGQLRLHQAIPAQYTPMATSSPSLLP